MPLTNITRYEPEIKMIYICPDEILQSTIPVVSTLKPSQTGEYVKLTDVEALINQLLLDMA